MENNQEYFKYLKTLKEKDLKSFIEDFKNLSSYPQREQYLKEYFSIQLIGILTQEDFIKAFYVDSQAKHISDKLKIDDISILKTLVYCYNTNARAFNKAQEHKTFESKMTQEGFKRISPEQKELNGLNVLCYTDILKFGLLDSNLKRELVEGKLLYSDYQKRLMILPKGFKKKGFIIRDNSYYKTI